MGYVVDEIKQDQTSLNLSWINYGMLVTITMKKKKRAIKMSLRVLCYQVWSGNLDLMGMLFKTLLMMFFGKKGLKKY